jgi:hypothetical protein
LQAAAIRSPSARVSSTPNGGNSKEFGGPIFLGKFTYNTCTQAATICESSAYLNNIKNVANYQQSFGNQNYTVATNSSASSPRTTTVPARGSPSTSVSATSARPSPTPASTSPLARALFMTS